MSDAEKANLSRYLAMRGIANADPQQALTALENMAIQSVPQPVLNPMVGMMSKDDQAKEYGRYRQAVAEYPAKVQEAITKVSDSIKSGNMDVVTQDLAKTASRIAQAGNERAQQEYARGRQAANQLVAMGVTAKPMPDADVKALQDVFIPAIADIKQAGNGFGGAMQAAIAKSKVDGSLNFDAILANLTAMGAMPSDQAAKIKAKLTPEAYTAFGAMAKAGSVDAIKEGLRGLGFDVGVGTGATNALWETSALGNVFQQAQAHGMTKSYFDKQSKVTPWSQESPTEVLSRQPQATPARQTSPRQTQSSGYSETKINAAGMEMGRRKSDGKWEPVR
jgi:hypothetical protein